MCYRGEDAAKGGFGKKGTGLDWIFAGIKRVMRGRYRGRLSLPSHRPLASHDATPPLSSELQAAARGVHGPVGQPGG